MEQITGEYDGHSPNREGAGTKTDILNQSSYDIRVPGSLQQDHCTRSPIGISFVFSRSKADENFWLHALHYRIYSIQQLFAGPDKDKDNSGASETGKAGSVFRLTYKLQENICWRPTVVSMVRKFPKSKRYGFFLICIGSLSISAEPSWNLSPEYFSNLKLRTSWGRANRQHRSPQYMSAYGTGGNAVFGGQNPEIAPGYTETCFLNPNITWETSEMFNIGIDASFFNGKLNLEADWFYKKTNDILRERTDMPGHSGIRTRQPM